MFSTDEIIINPFSLMYLAGTPAYAPFCLSLPIDENKNMFGDSLPRKELFSIFA